MKKLFAKPVALALLAATLGLGASADLLAGCNGGCGTCCPKPCCKSRSCNPKPCKPKCECKRCCPKGNCNGR